MVGSDHAPVALRADWQAQLRRCRRELGLRAVRFHGLLSDDVGTFIVHEQAPLYSFFNADQIVDFLLSIGMRPFVELSFMPAALASGDRTVFRYRGNVTPPTDYGTWGELVRRLVAHWKQRYGTEEVARWHFEVWNEPNLQDFWAGTQQDYWRLYRHAAQAVKSVDPSFRVGGPATAQNEWIAEFLDFCEREAVPADFVSTHHYPTDALGNEKDDTESQLSQGRRGLLRDQARRARQEAMLCRTSAARSSFHLAAAYLANRLYSQAHAYPTTHDMPIISTSVRRDAAEDCTFGNSEATFAPKNCASNGVRTPAVIPERWGKCSVSDTCPSPKPSASPIIWRRWRHCPHSDAHANPEPDTDATAIRSKVLSRNPRPDH